MKTKPSLSFWQIWNMSFGFLGIQFGFALQNANVSRIFETLGAKIDDIPILWIAAPVTGLIIQPIIGHMSDKTWGRLGRRRPFFLIGSILASTALFIMPNSPALWIAAGMLWIMDASINVSMEPFRAFVGDMLPSEQRTAGFAMQSFFIGTGAVVASALPWIMTNWFDIPNTAAAGEIPPSVKFSFYLGGAVFITAVAITVFTTKEYSPEELKEYSGESNEKFIDNESVDVKSVVYKSYKTGSIFLAVGIILSVLFLQADVEKELYILSFGLAGFGLSEVFSGFLQSKGKKTGFTDIFNDLNSMPHTMKQLAVVQFFSWFALFAMWIYTTSAVTSTKYDMKIDSELVSFLEKEIKISDTVKFNVPENELKSKINELQKYNQKLTSAENIQASVTFVSFFVNKIVDDKIIFDELIKSIKQNNDNSYEPQKNVLNEIENIEKELKFNNRLKVDLSYDAVLYATEAQQKEIINLPAEISEKLPQYLKLKKIRNEYNKGANWVGVLFGNYNGFAAVFAFLLIVMAKYTSRKITHSVSLAIGGIGLISVFYIANPEMLLIPFVAIGLAWASILAMPYAILTGSLPSNKMGTYMGIFNFFIVIPQILAASILGFLVKHFFSEESVYALILGGISMIIAAFTVFFVKDEN